MKYENSYRIEPNKQSPGDAKLWITTRVNDNEYLEHTFVMLSGDEADIRLFVAGEIDVKELRNRWDRSYRKHK
jgi:hypothetical protein